MMDPRQRQLASLIVVVTGALWGLYWLPVRRLAEALPGAWGSLIIVTTAALLLAPFALRQRRRLAATRPLTLMAIALGGAAFVMYSIGLVYGRVAIVILLFYLTPVWSTLIGRFWLHWPTPRLRYLAIGVGLGGLLLVLGADGGVPLPRSLGDWLGLASGLLWALSSTLIRTRSDSPGPVESNFVFVLGAVIAAAVLAPLLAPWPALPAPGAWPDVASWTLAAAALWWALSLAALLWATSRLEPARLGILLMSEVLVGVVSAALFVGEALGLREGIGGLLVIMAAMLELWPVRRPARH
ncbi:DMT family transporter [Modicisalibacter coralii]|uniref:DMT family transporter n=1 Tax=Modicisalibacter coralii TaxID=2304602 RepID=UPI00100AFE02|nr:DMT family transporter [Halomonas coralii]